MNHGRTISAQLLDFLPLHEFRKCVQRYRGNYKVQSFSCLDQFFGILRCARDDAAERLLFPLRQQSPYSGATHINLISLPSSLRLPREVSESQVARLKDDPKALRSELRKRLGLEGYDVVTLFQKGVNSGVGINAILARQAFSDRVKRIIEAAAKGLF